ncbi:MAG: ATP-grasp domain-containing protein [Actinomycetota bacterium]|nr:ATP-grasp domain-containing protein [Actinomycetota bacterium]
MADPPSGPIDIVVIGLDEENLPLLEDLPEPAYRFHGVFEPDDLIGVEELDFEAVLTEAEKRIAALDVDVDAIVGYWDFPVTSMVSILCARRGLPGASLAAVARCEHKYWSRLEQSKVVDDLPAFAIMDLDADRLPEGMEFPVWVKPVKSVSSALAFHVDDQAELTDAMAEIREGADAMGEPFQHVLDRVDLPPEIAEIGGTAALVEESVSGRQVTVEGYEYAGDVRVHGIIDSVTYPDSPSFLRYQYPSSLPGQVQERLAASAKSVIAQLGLTGSAFNIEYFWNPETDRLAVLEVNPRHSQSHAWIFEQVDGLANHQVMVRLGLGRNPELPHRQGAYPVAAKCFVRSFVDGVVTRAPSAEEVARIEAEHERVHVQLVAGRGQRLADLRQQDSYSYELARVYAAARDEDALVATYDEVVAQLGYEVEER